jgi:Domain of unknown function (DUF4158)
VSAVECPAPRRWSGVVLPEDPSEVARNWTLSEADKREATQCRGDENRRHFVLQVCVLRRHGRLLEGGEDRAGAHPQSSGRATGASTGLVCRGRTAPRDGKAVCRPGAALSGLWAGAASTPRFSMSWRSGSNSGRWRGFRWPKWRGALSNSCWAGKWCCHARRCSPACYSRCAGVPKGRCLPGSPSNCRPASATRSTGCWKCRNRRTVPIFST